MRSRIIFTDAVGVDCRPIATGAMSERSPGVKRNFGGIGFRIAKHPPWIFPKVVPTSIYMRSSVRLPSAFAQKFRHVTRPGALYLLLLLCLA